jgi:hypothetical protein
VQVRSEQNKNRNKREWKKNYFGILCLQVFNFYFTSFYHFNFLNLFSICMYLFLY